MARRPFAEHPLFPCGRLAPRIRIADADRILMRSPTAATEGIGFSAATTWPVHPGGRPERESSCTEKSPKCLGCGLRARIIAP